MLRPKTLIIAFLLGFAGCTSAMPSPAQVRSELWPFVTYELLATGDQGVRADTQTRLTEWVRRTAFADSTKDDDVVLMEGWLSSNTYGRLYNDQEVYAVINKNAERRGTQICRVTVTKLPDSTSFPYLFSFGGGTEWCSPPGRSPNAPTPSAVRSGWQRGRVAATAVFRSTDGTPMKVQHIANLNRAVPFSILGGDELLTFSKFPRQLEDVRNSKHDV